MKRQPFAAVIVLLCVGHGLALQLGCNRETPPVATPYGGGDKAELHVNPTQLEVTSAVSTNPAAQNVQVSNTGKGALKWQVVVPAQPWFSVTPLNGTNDGRLTVSFTTLALAAGTYTAAFQVTAPEQPAAPVNIRLIVSGTPPAPEVCGDGKDNDGDGAIDENPPCVPPPNPTSGRGPQPTITCPAGAIPITPGQNIQQAIDGQSPGATFCLKAGVHPVTKSMTPKSGQAFVGEYGAILDGTGWSSTVFEDAAFRAHSQDINEVTIRNLVIRHMPQRGIHTYSSGSCVNHECSFSSAGADKWVIEHNEIAYNALGIEVSTDMIIRKNYIHHNVGSDPTNDRTQGGAFESLLAQRALFEDNEVSYNGMEQKAAALSPNTVFRNNWVHHNQGNGIWYDGENPGSIIEGNTVEDNVSFGIFYEVSGQGVIRNNIIRRNGDNGILIATSHNVEITGNTLEDNFRAINYFINCDILGAEWGGEIGEEFYVQNLNAHDNTIKVGTRSGSWANALTLWGCDAAETTKFTDGSQNLKFTANHYTVPNVSAGWWVWADVMKTWQQWQSLGNDTTGFGEITVANLLTNTEDFSHADWSNSAVTVTTNTTAAPSFAGIHATLADTLNDASAVAQATITRFTTPSVANTDYTFSIYILKDSTTSRFPAFGLNLYGTPNRHRQLALNTQTGATGNAGVDTAPASSNVTDVDGTWWRLSMTETTAGMSATDIAVVIFPARASTLTGAPDSTVTGSIIAWGANLTPTATAETYEPHPSYAFELPEVERPPMMTTFLQ